jgi:hypothetical protein
LILPLVEEAQAIVVPDGKTAVLSDDDENPNFRVSSD